MKKTIFISQIIQTIFIILLISIALLQNSGVIALNKSLIPLYIISILGYTFVLTIIYIILMVKNKESEKFIGIYLLIMIIELFLLVIFCTGIDNRIDKIKFRKQCGETKATIYKIEQRETWGNDKEKKK